MKTHPSRRKNGFTLIELLVVIAIIAVLAGAGFAVGLSSIQKARKVTALNTCLAIESAVNQYYSEYNGPPVAGLPGTSDPTPFKTTDSSGRDLLKVLLGIEGNVANPLNPRNIKFLSVTEAKNKKGGLIYNSDGSDITGLYDPWGGPYYIKIDGDYDESVSPQPYGTTSPTRLNGRKAAVWSQGADGVSSNTGKLADDVRTW